ncbi:hypothetical protein HDU97_002787 [Phlyctochytrium planicorne]|nr:hypothetical protein HDU97_002787 [Phlyctochytrium planicorne]
MVSVPSPSPSSPPYPFYCGAEQGGFAFPTVNTRWPVILTSIIDDITRRNAKESIASPPIQTISHLPQIQIGSESESKDVISRIAALKYEVWRGKGLRPIENDGGDDVKLWNEHLEQHFKDSTFYTASWLWVECYVYRRVREAFRLSPSWKEYDPFLMQKLSAFVSSFDSVLELSTRLKDGLQKKELLRELILLSLWGNATDLSMFAGMDESQIAGMKAGSGEENILVNHLDAVCAYVDGLEGARFDYILDNSGFELFSDLLLADHLHQSGRAKESIFHIKAMPWFVSDTNQHDVEWILLALEKPEEFFKQSLKSPTSKANLDPTLLEHVKSLAVRWRGCIERKEWVFVPHTFWTTGWSFHHIPTAAPDLWATFCSSSKLLIFKGDLNYRKLVYDCKWPVETPFVNAIGSLTSGPPLVSLRTNKSDPFVGLPAGKEKEILDAGHADWRWSGKFAVVGFSQGSLTA